MNKNHWYDGKFFDLFIAPNQDTAFAMVKDEVNEGSSVLDVGCGTGRLAFQLANKCSAIDGIDPSRRNVQTALSRLAKERNDKIAFHHAGALEFLSARPARYDFATLSYVIHEVDEEDRVGLIRTLSSAAEKIILVDYRLPRRAPFRKAFDDLVELAAGPGHYRNFRTFIRSGALPGLVRRAGLNLIEEPRHIGSSGEMLVVSSN